MERRTRIRVLLAFVVAVPLVVEGATLVGLVGAHLDDDPATTSATPVAEGVDAGEELLAETDRHERLTSATLAGGDQWVLTLAVRVNNTAEAPYTVRLGAVTTDQGETVDGDASTGRIPAGETATVTEQWTLPQGSTPATVAVAATRHGDGGDISTTVRLASIPVEG
jgi:hypothetical protein